MLTRLERRPGQQRRSATLEMELPWEWGLGEQRGRRHRLAATQKRAPWCKPECFLPLSPGGRLCGWPGRLRAPGASSPREARLQGREPPEEAARRSYGALVSDGRAREAHLRLAGRLKSKRPKALGLRGLVF